MYRCLDDIRVKLNDLSDASIKQEISDNLTLLETMLTDRDSELKSLKESNSRLIEANGSLLKKVDGEVENQKPSKTIDLQGVIDSLIPSKQVG